MKSTMNSGRTYIGMFEMKVDISAAPSGCASRSKPRVLLLARMNTRIACLLRGLPRTHFERRKARVVRLD
jgi:hypothetical protein